MNYKLPMYEVCLINLLTVLVTASVSWTNQWKEKNGLSFPPLSESVGSEWRSRSWGNTEIHTLLNNKKSMFNKTLLDRDFLSVQYGPKSGNTAGNKYEILAVNWLSEFIPLASPHNAIKLIMVSEFFFYKKHTSKHYFVLSTCTTALRFRSVHFMVSSID